MVLTGNSVNSINFQICTIDAGENGEPTIVAITPELEYRESIDPRNVNITALAISSDTNFYAVGYSTGIIEVSPIYYYKISRY